MPVPLFLLAAGAAKLIAGKAAIAGAAKVAAAGTAKAVVAKSAAAGTAKIVAAKTAVVSTATPSAFAAGAGGTAAAGTGVAITTTQAATVVAMTAAVGVGTVAMEDGNRKAITAKCIVQSSLERIKESAQSVEDKTDEVSKEHIHWIREKGLRLSLLRAAVENGRPEAVNMLHDFDTKTVIIAVETMYGKYKDNAPHPITIIDPHGPSYLINQDFRNDNPNAAIIKIILLGVGGVFHWLSARDALKKAEEFHRDVTEYTKKMTVYQDIIGPAMKIELENADKQFGVLSSNLAAILNNAEASAAATATAFNSIVNAVANAGAATLLELNKKED